MTLEELLKMKYLHKVEISGLADGNFVAELLYRKPTMDYTPPATWAQITESRRKPTIGAALADLREAIDEEIATNWEWWR